MGEPDDVKERIGDAPEREPGSSAPRAELRKINRIRLTRLVG